MKESNKNNRLKNIQKLLYNLKVLIQNILNYRRVGAIKVNLILILPNNAQHALYREE